MADARKIPTGAAVNVLPFNVPVITLTPEEVEIRAWLKANRDTLAGRDATEVASLAVLCGFHIADVCFALSNFQDAMQGSHLENRLAFQAWRQEMAMAEFFKLRKKLEEPEELNLLPQWRELVAYSITGEETTFKGGYQNVP
jgi:hypothetical protein